MSPWLRISTRAEFTAGEALFLGALSATKLNGVASLQVYGHHAKQRTLDRPQKRAMQCKLTFPTDAHCMRHMQLR